MKDEIVLYQPDATVKLEVRLQDDTVWLNQQQMGELFGVNRQAITKHLRNIYETHELEEPATCSILELLQVEGKRRVRREVAFYNLDAIISVGFRVNTHRGIQFRRWAPFATKKRPCMRSLSVCRVCGAFSRPRQRFVSSRRSF